MFDAGKLEWLGYLTVKKLWQYIKPFSSNPGASRTYRRTDGRTHRRTELLYQYCASVCWGAIKHYCFSSVCKHGNNSSGRELICSPQFSQRGRHFTGYWIGRLVYTSCQSKLCGSQKFVRCRSAIPLDNPQIDLRLPCFTMKGRTSICGSTIRRRGSGNII